MNQTETFPAEQEVRDLGRRLAAAELRSDATELASLLAGDFICVGPLGFVLTKEQYLGARRSGDLRHRSLAWEDVQVRVYGDAAVAVGTQTQESTYQERDASGRFRVTQVAARQAEGWLLVSLHLSPIVQPPAQGAGARPSR